MISQIRQPLYNVPLILGAGFFIASACGAGGAGGTFVLVGCVGSWSESSEEDCNIILVFCANHCIPTDT